jgi:hypothetical protein
VKSRASKSRSQHRNSKGADGQRDTESIYANSLDEIDPNIYESAEDKLATLAVQLGESCLTNDLAALMNQKRDFELVESARKGKRP